MAAERNILLFFLSIYVIPIILSVVVHDLYQIQKVCNIL